MTTLTAGTRDAVADALLAVQRRGRRRAALVLAALALLLVVAAGAELLIGGSADIAPGEVLPAALGLRDGLNHYVVHETRVPRALTAVFAGALLGLSGALYQRLFGNPLATPDVIGVSGGAGAGAVLAITAFSARGVGVQAGALAGACVVAALVYLLSWRGGVSTHRLVLVGIGLGACASALTQYLLLGADERSTERSVRWLIGSLNGADHADARLLGVTLLAVLAASVPVRAGLGNLGLGDDVATGLGTRVASVRLATLFTGAVVAAVATSVTGPVAFVALVAGPIAARLVRAPDAPVTAAAVGAVLVAAADVAAQTAPLISPVPTGALTAVLGAPALVVLLLARRTT